MLPKKSNPKKLIFAGSDSFRFIMIEKKKTFYSFSEEFPKSKFFFLKSFVTDFL